MAKTKRSNPRTNKKTASPHKLSEVVAFLCDQLASGRNTPVAFRDIATGCSIDGEQQVMKLLHSLVGLVDSVDIDNKQIHTPVEQGKGRPKNLTLAARRGRAFAYLYGKQLDQPAQDKTCQIKAKELVERGIVGNEDTARKDLETIYDFAHSMRLTEDALKAGTYAFSSYMARQERRTDLKHDIALAVAERISPGTSIACTEGSTTAACIGEILRRHQHVSIVTNNLLVFQPGANEHVDVFLCGGDYHSDSHCTTGRRAVKGFKDHVCDVALIGAYAIDKAGRAYVYHHNDCAVQCAAIESVVDGGQLIVACDASKLGNSGRWSVFDLPALAKNKQRKIVLVEVDPKNWTA